MALGSIISIFHVPNPLGRDDMSSIHTFPRLGPIPTKGKSRSPPPSKKKRKKGGGRGEREDEVAEERHAAGHRRREERSRSPMKR